MRVLLFNIYVVCQQN